MTTEGQMLSFDLEPTGAARFLKGRALDAIRRAGDSGATCDEAYALAFPDGTFGHSTVDSFRVGIRQLREDGLVRDAGIVRPNRAGDRPQTVWVLGDDRDVVEQHRRRKLRKFPSEWLRAELRARRAELRARGEA